MSHQIIRERRHRDRTGTATVLTGRHDYAGVPSAFCQRNARRPDRVICHGDKTRTLPDLRHRYSGRHRPQPLSFFNDAYRNHRYAIGMKTNTSTDATDARRRSSPHKAPAPGERHKRSTVRYRIAAVGMRRRCDFPERLPSSSRASTVFRLSLKNNRFGSCARVNFNRLPAIRPINACLLLSKQKADIVDDVTTPVRKVDCPRRTANINRSDHAKPPARNSGAHGIRRKQRSTRKRSADATQSEINDICRTPQPARSIRTEKPRSYRPDAESVGNRETVNALSAPAK